MNLLVLDTVNKRVTLQLGGPVTTTECDWTSHWSDDTGTSFTEGNQNGTTAGAGAITVVSAPAAGVRRIVKEITVYNRDTVQVVLTFVYVDGANQRILQNVTLDPGELYTFCHVYTTSGNERGMGGGTGSGSADPTSAQFNALSNKVSQLSNNISIVSNAASNALSVANAASNAVSIVSNALSNEISNRASAVNVVSNAASNALSVANAASNAASIVSNALSNEISNRISADNVLSQQISVISQQVSVLSQQASVVSAVVAFYVSLQNLDSVAVSAGIAVYAFTSADTFKRAAVSVGGASAIHQEAIGLVADASIAVSAVGRVQTLGKVVLTAAQWDDATGQVGGLTPGAIYYLESIALGTPGRIVPNGPGGPGGPSIRPIGVALSSTELLLHLSHINDQQEAVRVISNAASNALSVANAASQAVSVVSTAASNALSVANAASNAASNALSVANAASNAASIVSNQLSITSSNLSLLASVVTVSISNQLSILSQGISVVSNAASNALSVANAASNKASAISQFLSAISCLSVGGTSVKGLQSVVNALSNRISAVTGGSGSVTSTEVSAVSAQAASAISVVSAAVTSVDARLNSVISTTISTLSNEISVLSNLVSNLISVAVPQTRMISTAATVSGTALTTVTGLSLAVSAGSYYRVEGFIFYTVSAVGAVAFGLNYPGVIRAGGYMTLTSAYSATGGTNIGSFTDNNFSGSAIVSASAQVSASTYVGYLNAYFQVSTTGNIHLLGRVSVGTQTLVVHVGSYLKAWKIAG